jgi:ethanolamine ammonia-lyase large subunit
VDTAGFSRAEAQVRPTMRDSELRNLLALANDFKEGDLLVGGTRDDAVREDARRLLLSTRLGDIAETVIVEDGVTEALARSADRAQQAKVACLTVSDLKQILVAADCAAWVERHRDGLASEVIAAVVKVMTNDELAAVARKLFNPLPGDGVTIGSAGHFGSRIQPNSPGDDEQEILFSILEGLAYGCGDVILGLNPASDDVDTIARLETLLHNVVERLELPTRYCVLSDIVKQTSARSLAPVDVGFQSLAGTSKALAGMVGLDVDGVVDLARGFSGLYFETGQGSAVTNGAAEGVDMVTLESRAYGVARYIRKVARASAGVAQAPACAESWMIVNDVAGFIGPEVFRTPAQLMRACVEDSVMGKLHGLTMGLDVCATFHMGIDPGKLRHLTANIVRLAAPAYLMAVAGNADPMLGYLTTSFREHPRLRRMTGKESTTAMHDRLWSLGVRPRVMQGPARGMAAVESLYAAYMKGGGDTRSSDALAREAAVRIQRLQDRGFDLGYGCGPSDLDPIGIERRMDAIYDNARRALYARLDDSALGRASQSYVRVRTRAVDRADYLDHPPSGEAICDSDRGALSSLYPSRRPQIQFVISDGLNAGAVSENLPSVLPALKRSLARAGYHIGERDVVIDNGRVRAGYHAGALVGAESIVHFIGERPGTGLNTLSAYITYGRDQAGGLRWSADLDHSETTAICGINRYGKRPKAAVEEIAGCVKRMFDEHRSGVAPGPMRS